MRLMRMTLTPVWGTERFRLRHWKQKQKGRKILHGITETVPGKRDSESVTVYGTQQEVIT